MTTKYLAIDDINGGTTEVAFAITGGVGKENQAIQTGSDGRIHTTFLPVGITPEVKIGNAFEAITARQLVYFKADGTVALASNTAGGQAAEGWADNSAAEGAAVTVNFEATITGLAGLTPNKLCFLGVAGAITQTVPTGAGVRYQEVGRALSATELQFSNAGFQAIRVA